MKTIALGNFAFIDGQNLYLSIKNAGWKLDFQKFRVLLKDSYKVEKAFIFMGYIPENQSLYTQLQQWGYLIIFKPTLQKNGITKGNCDAELVLHCILQKNFYNKAIIVSSDGDFHCLIEHLLEEKKLLKIITPTRNYSSLLRRFSNLIVSAELLKPKIEHKKEDIPAVQKPLVVPPS